MIKKVTRKSLLIRESNRSSNYITPSFGHGCLFKCTYCYMRRNKPSDLTVATNTYQILDSIDEHVNSLQWPKIKDQTHDKYWTYDLSCNEDFALHAKHHEWEEIFEFFKVHPRAMGTLATKFVNRKLLEYNPNRKVRIRFSLMPQNLSSVLEPNTSSIIDRINAVNDFYNAGYDVHLNFSPVVVYKDYIDDYIELFNLVDENIDNSIKQDVKAEVIFLTHSKNMHQYNMCNGQEESENILWTPEIQEPKTSNYGGNNLRYKHYLKSDYIQEWKEAHNEIIPWNTIRYIF